MTFPAPIDDQPHGVELELGGPGVWEDVTPDLLRRPSLGWSYGIAGTGPLDLSAGTGRISFALNNSEENSVGLIGYYSPGHANCRAGFALGVGVRYRYTSPLTGDFWWKFVGRLNSIDPIYGRYGERKTRCSGVDYIDELTKIKPVVPTQVNKRTDEVLTAIIAAVPDPPHQTMVFDMGDSSVPYALDSGASEQSTAATLVQRTCQSEGRGMFYIRGGQNGIGSMRFEKRTARLTPMPVHIFDGDMQGLTAPRDRSKIRNRAKVAVHPRRVDTSSATVLFLDQSAPSVPAGQTVKLTGRYTDPTNRSNRVGGTDMQAPFVAISTSSVANPTTITTAVPHGLVSGDSVVIFGHTGSTPTINGTRVVTVTGPTTFTIPVNVTVAGTGGSATADFLMNTAANGSGSDLTSSLTVVTLYGANSVEHTITNGSASLGYITKRQARGKGLYDYDPVEAWELDQTSIDEVGENLVSLDMTYEDDLVVAGAIAEFMVAVWTQLEAVEIGLKRRAEDWAHTDELMALEPGDAVTVLEYVTGVNGVYYIQNIDFTLDEDGVATFDFGLQRALVADFWLLGTVGFSELGLTTVLAPL